MACGDGVALGIAIRRRDMLAEFDRWRRFYCARNMGDGAVGGDPRYKGPQGRISAKAGQRPPQREMDFLDQFLSQMHVGFIAGGDTLYHGAMVPRDLIEGLDRKSTR